MPQRCYCDGDWKVTRIYLKAVNERVKDLIDESPHFSSEIYEFLKQILNDLHVIDMKLKAQEKAGELDLF